MRNINWKILDRQLRRGSAAEVDLIESYAQKKISRRNFVDAA